MTKLIFQVMQIQAVKESTDSIKRDLRSVREKELEKEIYPNVARYKDLCERLKRKVIKYRDAYNNLKLDVAKQQEQQQQQQKTSLQTDP
ncbi:hypothetical protein CANARDRAFT_30803 [[Candida] arabinofermentans NRRL YB-2248]|uniref:Uncharacterized protein n=1 Tax=[Candida] arabinofermentans NRRL YB-2248 TaxID=983967 RepID=A0A1E4SSK8_9ASCO|nr:hypothetical protein CANARDRAFT_30803 [[Candida] arabinofermentans NRRL YB-2248]